MQVHSSIKEKLEQTYDLPFVAENGMNTNDPWFTVAPYTEDQSLFYIRLTFRNSLRLIIDFEPHKYGANLIRSMGMASEEQRLAFCSFARILTDKGGKIEFTINHLISDPLCSIDWPRDWRQVRIRVTFMPISDHEEPYYKIPYNDIANEWGSLMMGMVLSLLDIIPLDGTGEVIKGYEEGNKVEVLVNKYERNPINRALCLTKYGYKCCVCGFDFASKYGDIGKDFIHVHHIVPVSRIGEHYIVDPLNDLLPVCPNCHAMLHKDNMAFSIEDLKSRICKMQVIG